MLIDIYCIIRNVYATKFTWILKIFRFINFGKVVDSLIFALIKFDVTTHNVMWIHKFVHSLFTTCYKFSIFFLHNPTVGIW